MINVGLLGAGRIGKVHAMAIASDKNSRLLAIGDVNAASAATLAEQYGASAKPVADIIQDPAIDAVLIATSTDTHAELIEAAVDAGKAVFCEKPVDLSLERARACQQFVDNASGRVMIGFNRRFDPHFTALKQALKAEEIGKAELLSITSFDPEPPPISYVKVSGGIFRDMTIHDFDMAAYLFDAQPLSVSAIGSSQVDPAIGECGDFDTAVITLSYEGGRLAVIKNSRRAVYGYDQRIEVLGSDGLLQANNTLRSTVVKSTTEGVAGDLPTYFFLERYTDAYKAEWNAFAQAIISDTPVPSTLHDGVMALAVAEAATRSAVQGTPVHLSDV